LREWLAEDFIRNFRHTYEYIAMILGGRTRGQVGFSGGLEASAARIWNAPRRKGPDFLEARAPNSEKAPI